MNAHDAIWLVGRPVLGGSAALATRLHSHGADRIPTSGGVVLAFNHFSWIDIPCFGWVCRRNLYFLAKGDGSDTTAFAKTLAEHKKNIKKYAQP